MKQYRFLLALFIIMSALWTISIISCTTDHPDDVPGWYNAKVSGIEATPADNDASWIRSGNAAVFYLGTVSDDSTQVTLARNVQIAYNGVMLDSIRFIPIAGTDPALIDGYQQYLYSIFLHYRDSTIIKLARRYNIHGNGQYAFTVVGPFYGSLLRDTHPAHKVAWIRSASKPAMHPTRNLPYLEYTYIIAYDDVVKFRETYPVVLKTTNAFFLPHKY